MAAKWHGIAEARRQFARLPDVVRNAANTAVDATRKVAVAAAKERVPVLTGALKKSISSRMDKRRAKATVSTKAPHAHFVEYGTVHSAAKPFFAPAADRAKSEFETRAKETAPRVERDMRQA